MRPTSAHVDVEDLAARLRVSLEPGLLELLAQSPLETIEQLLDIRVFLREESRTADGCGVDGSYFPDPPRMNIAASVSPGRRNFTALHELGHHLLLERHELGDMLSMLPDGAREAEEEVCNAFASSILVPDHIVDEIVGPDGPTAAQVAEIHRSTEASRSACAATVARRVPGCGYVIVARGATVVFAAQVGRSYVVAPGTVQPDDSVVAKAARIGHARQRSRVRYATENLSGLMFGDAVSDGEYVFAVLTNSARLPWTGLGILVDHGPVREERTCVWCDFESEPWAKPCVKCGDPPCPRCRHCGCESATPQGRCPVCYLMAHRDHITENGCPHCT